jgi:4-amino-4-deoxy-L-arabinose transferase
MLLAGVRIGGRKMTTDRLADILLAGLTAGLLVAMPYAYRRRQEYWFPAILLLLSVVWRVYGAMDPLLHAWDERYHALVARHLMEAPLVPRLYQSPALPFDYRNWTANEIWLHKQPFPLWVMAGGLSLLGLSPLALRIPSLFLSVWSVWLTYRIGKRLFPVRVAWLAAGFHAVNGLVLETAAGRVTTDHIDTFFLFLVEAAVYFLVRSAGGVRLHRRDLLLAGMVTGLAILTKWLSALVVLPLCMVWSWSAGRQGAVIRDTGLLAGTALAIALPWQWYAWRQFPLEYTWEMAYNFRHLSEGLEQHGKPWWYYLDKIRITVNEGIYVAMGWMGVQLVRRRCRDRRMLFLAVWITIPLVFFSMARTKLPGYQLIAFPAYFLLLGCLTERLLTRGRMMRAGPGRWIHMLPAVLMMILAVRYGLERLKPFRPREAQREVAWVLENMKIPPNSIVFNVPCPIEMMFYHDCTAYEGLPTEEWIQGWLAEGKQVLILDAPGIPPSLRLESGIRIIRYPELHAYYRTAGRKVPGQ